MTINALAVSAPDRIAGANKSENAIDSVDPASLFNACRYAGHLAATGVGSWGESNWAGSRERRRSFVWLMRSWEDDREVFRQQLETQKPNLLFLGAMSLSFPGAVECARLAKSILGDDVCVVLGGRHVNETVFSNVVTKSVQHHAGSPLRLMDEGVIPRVFDIVAAGDCEYLVAATGELVDQCVQRDADASSAKHHCDQLRKTRGKWIAGALTSRGIECVQSIGDPLDYDALPVPCGTFGVRTSFDIYPGRKTAHVFSDTGRGCAYNCAFCSEARDVAGPLMQVKSSASRLYRQLSVAVTTIRQDSPNSKASAFIEDSLLLAGRARSMDEFADLLEKDPLRIRFGAQLTIDQILQRKQQLRRLQRVGLDYMFIGLETLDPDEIGGMSKDIGGRRGSWKARTEEALGFLSGIGIRCGAAVLFGLGESHRARMGLLSLIKDWRREFGAPAPVSMNWATQHPLMGLDAGANYQYHKWGTPKGPYLDAFRHFGEASLNYCLPNVGKPDLAEVQEIVEEMDAINRSATVEIETVAKRATL